METEEEKIRIDYSKHFFTRSDYKIYNQYTGELIGHFDIPNGGIGRTTMKSTLYFTTGQKYEWRQNNQGRNILEIKNSSVYRFDLLSEQHSIVYYGKMTPDVAVSYVNPYQTFEGEIQTTNDQLLVPILAGMHIMEEKFRRIEQDLG